LGTVDEIRLNNGVASSVVARSSFWLPKTLINAGRHAQR
jgi:hypothetical protein